MKTQIKRNTKIADEPITAATPLAIAKNNA
jgi:hypothetical protein